MKFENKILPIIILTLLASIFLGCSSFGKIVVKEDAFKNAKLVSLKLRHKSEEKKGLFGSRTYGDLSYYKEVSDGSVQVFSIKYKFFGANVNSDTIVGKDAFVKLGKEKIKINDLKSKVISRTSVKKSTDTEIDHSKGVKSDGTFHKKEVETSKSTTHYYLIGKFDLKPSLLNKIANTSSLVYRFYLDENPITLKVLEGDLLKLQEFSSK